MSTKRAEIEDERGTTSEADHIKEKKVLTWGGISMLLGLMLILITLYVDALFHHPQALSAVIFLKFLDHIGIAIFTIGLIGIMVEFKDWRDYFRDRLADIIRHKTYLQTLEDDELLDIQTNVLEALYKAKRLDVEGSFLKFYNSKIRDYIASPYREDTRGVIKIEPPDVDGSCILEETIMYKCRKGANSSIQSEVKWHSDAPDIIGDLIDYHVTLQMPENFYQSPDFTTKYPNASGGKIVFNKDNDRLVKSDKDHGFTLSLSEFEKVDNLLVTACIKYMIPVTKFATWFMAYPSKGFSATINYPEHLEIVMEAFGMDSNKLQITSQKGVYSLDYDSWVLPDTGLAYQLREKKAAPQAGPPTEKKAQAATAPGPTL